MNKQIENEMIKRASDDFLVFIMERENMNLSTKEILQKWETLFPDISPFGKNVL